MKIGSMAVERHLDWEGCWNARDLGGLRTIRGPVTCHRAVVRSESLHLVSRTGWLSLQDYGIATIVDLRNPGQAVAERQQPPPGMITVQVPLEEGLDADPEFKRWKSSGWLGTPLYFRRFIERWPDRCARAVAAVAEAPSGGVIVHCGKGSDRTGLAVMLLLSLVGVLHEEIAADYEMTAERLQSARAAGLGRVDDASVIETVLEREDASARGVLLDILGSVDVRAALKPGGLRERQVQMLHRRLLED